MLPESLIFLLTATTVYAQARPNLELNKTTSLNTQRLPQPPSFAIPQQRKLWISIALCSDSSSFPRFFVSNISNLDSQSDPGPNGGPNVFEIVLEQGQGNWTGTFVNGGILAVNSNGATGVPFELAVSDGGALY
jgi:calcium channel MID1